MVGFIIGVVGFGILILLGVSAQLRRDKDDGVIARFADFRLSRTHLYVGSARYPLPGVTARVESEGEIRKRVTATRVLATGVFALALKKKIDERSVFLTIEGPNGVAIVREIAVAKEKNAPVAARSFAASVNSAAMSSGTVQQPAQAAVAPAPPGEQARQLMGLSKMYARGELSEAEFQQAKAELLGHAKPQDETA